MNFVSKVKAILKESVLPLLAVMGMVVDIVYPI